MEIQTLHNPAALDIPEVRAALNKWSMVSAWHDALKLQMSVGAAAVIVGTDKDVSIDAASIVTLPQAFTDTLPWVVHFHNEGPRELTHAMVNATLAFVKQAGYTGFKAFNQSGKPDKVWLKIFKGGGTPRFIGSAYIFDLNEDITDGSNSARRRGSGDRVKPVRRQRQRRQQLVRKVDAKQQARRSNTAVVPAARSNRRRKSR